MKTIDDIGRIYKNRPRIEQQTKRDADFLAPLPGVDFLVAPDGNGMTPLVYCSGKEDDEWEYYLYCFYHTEDYSTLPWPANELDSHKHDFEGVLLFKSKHRRVRHICAVSHWDFICDTVYGDDWTVVIEAEGHAVKPWGRHKPWDGDLMVYRKAPMFMINPVCESEWWKRMREVFNSNGVKTPDQWNDATIRKQFGEETDGDIFLHPDRLLKHLRDTKRIL